MNQSSRDHTLLDVRPSPGPGRDAVSSQSSGDKRRKRSLPGSTVRREGRAISAGQAFVGIDAGTTGCTVMIFDESGNRLGQGYQEYPCTSPRPGWIEQDAEQVWAGICAAAKVAVAAAAL